MEIKSRKGLNRRSSIITIIIVILLIAFIAFFIIKILDKVENEDNTPKKYISNLDEEDMMQYEYSKIDESLSGMYAFAILDDYIVAVKGKDEIVNIIQIDSDKEYDYKYNDKKLYLLEKDSGKINIVDLVNLGNIEDIIELGENINSFEIYNNNILYISNGRLLKYENGNIEEILTQVSSNNFVIKNDDIYIVKDNNLIKMDMNKNETIIDSNVKEIYYYNYYERDRLIYSTTLDNENVFKKVYNYYTGEIISSIKNDTYFVPYGASEYIYTTADNKNVVLIEKSGMNEYLYKSNSKIENIGLYKEGYIIIKDSDNETVIDLNTDDEVECDNIINLYGIKYLK